MWKTLISLVRNAFNLSRRVETHDQQIGELYGSARDLNTDGYRLSERMLRLELQLEHQKDAASHRTRKLPSANRESHLAHATWPAAARVARETGQAISR